MALGIVNDVTLSDISYLGGIPITDINHTDYFYNPLKNLAVYNEVLSDLVIGFKDIEKPKVLYANVLDKLPFSNKSFDYVIGDPPYGVNLNSGKGIEMFVEAQQELLRVSKYGILAFIPQDWINEFQNNINIQVLSDELLHEKTTLKTSLVQISQ